MFEIPSQKDIKYVEITEDVVLNGADPILKQRLPKKKKVA